MFSAWIVSNGRCFLLFCVNEIFVWTFFLPTVAQANKISNLIPQLESGIKWISQIIIHLQNQPTNFTYLKFYTQKTNSSTLKTTSVLFRESFYRLKDVFFFLLFTLGLYIITWYNIECYFISSYTRQYCS